MTNPRYDIRALASGGHELLIYGDIGDDPWAEESNDAKGVVSRLNELSGDIDLRINSFGGSVAEGLAIFNALQRYPGRVTAHVDGVAYSIASLILMGADDVVMPSNALLMIHAPWGLSMGNSAELRRQADTLDKYAEAMRDAYDRGGKGPSKDQVWQWLTDGKDHYFTAAEADALGLVDTVGYALPELDIAANLRTPRFSPPAEVIASARPHPRPETPPMADTTTPGASDQQAPDTYHAHQRTIDAAKAAGAQAEAKRRGMVDQVFATFLTGDELDPVTAVYRSCMDDPKVDEAQARIALLDVLARRTADPVLSREHYNAPAAPTRAPAGLSDHVGGLPPRFQAGADAGDKLVEGAVQALEVRAGLVTDREQARAARRGNELMGASFVDMAKACLVQAGVRPQGTSRQILQQAVRAAAGPGQGTDHFLSIMENVAEKAALTAFDETDETWSMWAKTGSVPDFKSASRVNLSTFGELDELMEMQQYEEGNFSDLKETIQATNHGKKYSISLEALVNDDIGILTRIPAAMGRAAQRTIGTAVYAVLTSNPTMTQDSKTLFHADHSNYVTAGAVPSIATISTGRKAMALQTDPNGATLGIRPRYIIHPVALEDTILGLINDTTTHDNTSRETPSNPIRRLGLISVAEHRLDTANAAGWYLAADYDTVEVAFVDGQMTPELERMNLTDVDGVSWKVRLPFGVAPMDYRTLYYNDGAS